MRTLSISAILLSAVSLSACVSATSPDSYGAKEQSYLPLAEAVYLQATIPNPNYDSSDSGSPKRLPNKTIFASLPIGGATPEADLKYKGLFWSSEELDGCVGGCGPKSLPEVRYFADLNLEIDLDGQDVSGTLANFFTDRTWFAKPNGTIELTGEIYELDGFAYILFSGEDTLTYDQFTAILKILSAEGGFGGSAGQVLAGEFISDFEWIAGLNGLYVGTISESDGLWVAELN